MREKKEPPSKPRCSSPESVLMDTHAIWRSSGVFCKCSLENPSLTPSPASPLAKSSEKDGD